MEEILALGWPVKKAMGLSVTILAPGLMLDINFVSNLFRVNVNGTVVIVVEFSHPTRRTKGLKSVLA